MGLVGLVRCLRAAVVGHEEDRLAAGYVASDGHDSDGGPLWYDWIVQYESAWKGCEFVTTAEGTLHVAQPEGSAAVPAVPFTHDGRTYRLVTLS